MNECAVWCLVNSKGYEILLLRDTAMLPMLTQNLEINHGSSYIIAGGLQSEITGYSIS